MLKQSSKKIQYKSGKQLVHGAISIATMMTVGAIANTQVSADTVTDATDNSQDYVTNDILTQQKITLSSQTNQSVNIEKTTSQANPNVHVTDNQMTADSAATSRNQDNEVQTDDSHVDQTSDADNKQTLSANNAVNPSHQETPQNQKPNAPVNQSEVVPNDSTTAASEDNGEQNVPQDTVSQNDGTQAQDHDNAQVTSTPASDINSQTNQVKNHKQAAANKPATSKSQSNNQARQTPTTSTLRSGVPNIVAGTPGLPHMDFVDVSSWNGNLTVADFLKLKSYGVKGVIVKLTQGVSYLSPFARTQIANARAAGLQVAIYHYATYNSQNSAIAEAKYFAQNVIKLGLPKDTLLVDDLEDIATQVGNVTANALAFRNQLAAAGFNNQMLYTSPNFINVTGLNAAAFGLKNIWMASYPYYPDGNDLWHTQYGAWQWNSQTTFPGVSGIFDVSVDYGSPFLQPKNGYLNDGTGWYWYENGTRYTGFRHYMGTYYWFNNGVRQNNQWETAWGNKYYVGVDGRTVQGFCWIKGHQYYFGDNGTYYLRTNQLIKRDNAIYSANKQGILSPWKGYMQTANGGWRWYENGQFYTGFRYYMGTYYWFNNGVRQNNRWETAWGKQYYVGADGRAVQGFCWIKGHQYYFGDNGTYYLRTNQLIKRDNATYSANKQGVLSPWQGYMQTANGNWRWYENGQFYTGFRYYMGTYYWFENGVRQNNHWETAWGKQYYVGADGRAVQGVQWIDGKQYYFGDDGTFYLREQ